MQLEPLNTELKYFSKGKKANLFKKESVFPHKLLVNYFSEIRDKILFLQNSNVLDFLDYLIKKSYELAHYMSEFHVGLTRMKLPV